MTAYTDRFGGSTVQPSDVGFRAVSLSASITTVWPSFATAANECARIMKVTASAGSLTITLPDATLAATGQDVLFDNSGAETFTVLDSAGGSVCTLTAGQVKYLYLSDNSTAAGTWRVTLFGASSSNLDASQLAGYGLKAISNTINAAPAMTSVSGDTMVVAADRAKIFLWEGGSGTLTLPTTVGSTSDFHIEVRNQGSGTVTVQPVGGVLIDGSSNIELSVNESCFVHMGVTDWSTVGRGRNTAFNFTRLSKVVDGGTDTLSLTEASSVVQTYTGALLSNQVIEVPAVVQVYYISNGTTGSYTLGFKCVTGGSATVTVLQGQAAILFCDGSTVINANTSVSGITTIVFGAGSAAVPSVAIANSATGFYASGTNEIGVSLNGVYVGKFAAGGLTLDGLTASSAVATDASKKLVSVTNTGTGSNVLATSPTLVTPVLGVAAATTINKVTLTAPATGSTLTIADGKTFTANDNVTVGTGGITLGNSGGLSAAASQVLTVSNSITLSGSSSPTLAVTGTSTVSGANTGDQTNISGNAATATNVAVGGITGLGTGVATALAVNVGSAGAPVVFNGALGTPSSGTVTNLTGTASININGTVGATTPAAGSFTTLETTGLATIKGGINSQQAVFGNSRFMSIKTASDGTYDDAVCLFQYDSSVGQYKFQNASGGTTLATITSTGLNSTVIGATTPAAGSFTTLSASGLLSANANLKVVDGANDFGTIQLGTSASYKVTGGATYSGYRFEIPTGTQYDFWVNGTSRALVNGTGLAVTGALSATGLLDLSAATAGQIKFPETQNASADPNTLDDYEEGTWNPAQGGGLTVVGAFSSSGGYTKAGNLVVAWGKLVGATSVAATSGASITNIPFVAAGEIAIGSSTNGASTAVSAVQTNPTTTALYICEAVSATNAIYFSIAFRV